MKKIKEWFLNLVYESPASKAVVATLKKVQFKHYDVNLYDVIVVFIEKIKKDEIITRAYSVAFNFTLSIFPAVIFLFTLIPYFNYIIPALDSEVILDYIGTYMPEYMFLTIRDTIEDIVGKTRGGLLTFGAVFALYMATNGMLTLMNAFNAVYMTVEKRGFFKTRLAATLLTIMLAGALILAVILLIVGSTAMEYFNEIAWLQTYLFFILRFAIIFAVFLFVISTIYYFGPAVHSNWRFFSIGATMATILTLAVSYGFSFYVANFAAYNKLYGSIGVLIALMLWQFIISVVLLVGYEINASMHQANENKTFEED